MSGKNDDLEAVRVIADTLQPFDATERERIIRWARERVGMIATAQAPATRPPDGAAPDESTPPATEPTDIQTFVNQKAPRSEVHFAATIAYYHQFIAPSGERKDSITKQDLIDACRQVSRKRPVRSSQVLVNAFRDGIVDRGDTGHYKLNSVGENLVAMALPGKPDTNSQPRATKRTKKKATSTRRRAQPTKRARKSRD